MITPLLHITLPENSDEDVHDEERHFAPIILALQAMIAVNEWHIRRGLKRAEKGLGAPVPPLYASGVRYKEDPPMAERRVSRGRSVQVAGDGRRIYQRSMITRHADAQGKHLLEACAAHHARDRAPDLLRSR